MQAQPTRNTYAPLIVPRICDLFLSVYANSPYLKTRTPMRALRKSWKSFLGHERLLSMDFTIKTTLDRHWPFRGTVPEAKRHPDETPKRRLKLYPTRRRRINFSNPQPRRLFGKDTAPPKESTTQSIVHCQNKRKRLLHHQTQDQPCKRGRNDKENQPKDTPTRLPWKLIKMTFSPSQMETSLNNNKKFKGHPDPRQCLHDDITNGTELDKEDQAILAAHGFAPWDYIAMW